MPLTTHTFAKTHFLWDVDIKECLKPVEEDGWMPPGSGTKVLVTLGPSCQDVDRLVKMLEAGVTCARIDLTWGTLEFHRRSLRNLSAAMRQTRRLCSVWLNTAGREMVVRRKVEYDDRGWPMHGDSVKAEAGQTIIITTDPSAEASATVYPINYPQFPSLVEPGQVLQVGRYLSTGAEGGSLFLTVTEVKEDSVVCEAANSATLDGLLTVMICHTCAGDVDSSADLQLPLLTQHDVECIKTFSQEFEIDFISLSYCNSARDVYECRALLDSIHMAQTKIVAKVERKAAMLNFTAIAEAADGVILSRGNLGLDFDPEFMAILQKRAITKCNRMGKPIILTRIVDSMISAPRCTRAEATDVANAVLDGADGVMLGAETLRGQYPVATAETVLKLAASAEERFDYRQHHEMLVAEQFGDHPHSMGLARMSSGDLHSPDGWDQYGLSPTARLYPPSFFAVPASGGGGAGGQGQGNGALLHRQGSGLQRQGSGAAGAAAHKAYVASAASQELDLALTPPAFGSLLLPEGEAAEPDAAAVHAGPNGSTFASAGFQGGVYTSSFGNLNLLSGLQRSESAEALRRARASMAQVLKLESIASSAVKTAEKINAGLIVVMTQTGRTASLVAKYRPPMPCLAVVVPTLKSDGLGWRLEGKYLARQCLIIRGVVPMLAAPMSEGSDDLLSEAISLATSQKLAKPHDYVVCILSQKGALTFKVVQVNEKGTGMKMMVGGNSLIGGEDPDIVSSSSPFEAFGGGGGGGVSGTLSPRTFSRGLSFRGAGTFGAGLAGPMVMTTSDAAFMMSEGSVHGGVLGSLGSSDVADPPAGAAGAAGMTPRQLRAAGAQQRQGSIRGAKMLPGSLSP